MKNKHYVVIEGLHTESSVHILYVRIVQGASKAREAALHLVRVRLRMDAYSVRDKNLRYDAAQRDVRVGGIFYLGDWFVTITDAIEREATL